jgi:hypothetical protein
MKARIQQLENQVAALTKRLQQQVIHKADCDDYWRCSFCGKGQSAVRELISSPTNPPLPYAFICDECIAVCNSILEDK